jgi:hypothetical protein
LSIDLDGILTSEDSPRVIRLQSSGVIERGSWRLLQNILYPWREESVPDVSYALWLYSTGVRVPRLLRCHCLAFGRYFRSRGRKQRTERRAAREIELAAKITALPDKRYGVILADPPWRFEPWSRDTGMDRAADNHYPTLVTERIAALDVASIAAADCVLFLWATVPTLPDALAVMHAWRFTYRSHAIWYQGPRRNRLLVSECA